MVGDTAKGMPVFGNFPRHRAIVSHSVESLLDAGGGVMIMIGDGRGGR